MKLPGSGNSNDSPVMRLRAHHICCAPFWTGAKGSRGPRFQQVEDKIKGMLLSPIDSKVMVIEGADELCQECPLCVDKRCTSAKGDEETVRKWDAIVLKELGLTFNTCLTARQWHDLIKRKVPFKLCHRCQWKKECRIGRQVP